MPVINAEESGLVPSSGATGEKRSRLPTARTIGTKAGIPRFDDLLTVRILEDTPQVSLPLNTVKEQIVNTSWNVSPTVENPSQEHEDAVEEIEYWLDGHFNRNKQKLSHFMRRYVHDLLTIDTGVVEKVPTSTAVFDDGSHALKSIYNVDGLTMSKELDDYGRQPLPPDTAYWKFGHNVSFARLDPEQVETYKELIQEYSPGVMYYRGLKDKSPIPFSRDEILWTELNPRPPNKSAYGFGIVQQIKRWIEILLNQDISNITHFNQDEIPKGILNIQANNRNQLERTRDYIRDELKGKTDHNMLILGGGDENQWIPTQESLKELQYLESQRWYNQLVWMMFGLNESQIGFDVGSRATAEEFRRQVFLQTTEPMLDTIAEEWNTYILPYLEAYWWCDGELEFTWEIEDPDMEKLHRERQQQDLQTGVATINDVLRERGEDEKAWGDMPMEAVRALARKHPEWFAEQFTEMEDLPEEMPQSPVGFSSEPSSKKDGEIKPFGEWENFEDCVESMMEEQDYDRETAEKVCGKLEEELEGFTCDACNDVNNFNPYNLGEEVPESVKTDVIDKEALRNERGDFPNLKGDIDNMTEELGMELEDVMKEVEDSVSEMFPEEDTEERNFNKMGAITSTILDKVNVKDVLLPVVLDNVKNAMQKGADFEADNVEDQINEEMDIPEEVSIELDTNIQDTLAMQMMEQNATNKMTTVEETLRNRIEEKLIKAEREGWGAEKAREEIEKMSNNITTDHARLIARTEIMQSSRQGSQAFQERNDVVGGKRWRSTDDQRTRTWHEAMDGVIVDVNDSFTVPQVSTKKDEYQPPDYPREAFTVGEDQPFNCRCVQDSVLEEDMDNDIHSLSQMDGVEVKGLTSRQLEIWDELQTNENSFKELLEGIDEKIESRSKVNEELGLSKSTLYKWFREFGVE